MGKSVCFLLLCRDRSLHVGAALEAPQQLQDSGVLMLAEYQDVNDVSPAQMEIAKAQGFSRDASLGQIGFINAAAIIQLKQSIAAFERDVNMLIDGDAGAGVRPAPNVTIRGTLQKIRKLWRRLTPGSGSCG